MITETFIEGRGPLYSLDPRPKFILLLSAVIILLIESNPAVQGGLLLLLFILIGASLGRRRILKPVKSILPVLILTALLTPLFNPAGEAVFTLGSRNLLTIEGLQLTLMLILRFTGITAGFYLFFCTTETSEFILALRAFGLPYKAALTVTISLRYIPDMFGIYGRITDAHKLRSAGAVSGGRKKGFRNRWNRLFPVLISVLIHAVKNIPALAMALDSKGFGRRNPRSSCRTLTGWSKITLQLGISAVFLALLISAAVIW